MKVKNLTKIIGVFLFFCVLWWALTNGSFYQLWFGAVVVSIATFASIQIAKEGGAPSAVHIRAIVKFVPYFIFQSVSGGLSVAKIALLPKDRAHSKYHEFETALPRDAVSARMFFASCLCIFPGTLSCGFRDDALVIHALDEKLLDPKAIRDLESITAAIFSIETTRKIDSLRLARD